MKTQNLERAIDGAAGGPLSSEQKKRVVLLARRAWVEAGRPGFADQAEDLPEVFRLSEREAFDLWRHDEQQRATGMARLTCSENRCYPYYMAHFARLAGIEQTARHWEGRTVGDPRRIALMKLGRECDGARDVIENPAAYVAAIARSKFKTTDVESLGDKALWTLVFDVRRGAQKRRAKKEGARH